MVVNQKGEVLEDAPPANEIDYQAEFKRAAKEKGYEPMLPVFTLKKEGEIVAYTIPVMGKGLWSQEERVANLPASAVGIRKNQARRKGKQAGGTGKAAQKGNAVRFEELEKYSLSMSHNLQLQHAIQAKQCCSVLPALDYIAERQRVMQTCKLDPMELLRHTIRQLLALTAHAGALHTRMLP